jgi:hypothetical protein
VTRFTRFCTRVLAGGLLIAAACVDKNGKLLFFETDCLQDFLGFPAALSLSETEDKTLNLSWFSDACDHDIKVTATSDNPSFLTVGTISPSYSLVTRNDKQVRAWKADVPLWSKLPGSTSVHLDLDYGGDSKKRFDLPVTVAATKGQIDVQITGLGTGVAGNVFVGVGQPDGRTFTASGSDRFLAGDVPWIAYNATGSGGAVFQPMVSAGIVTLPAGGQRTLAVTYAQPSAQTGAVNVQMSGLPSGTNGNVTLSGNGIAPMTLVASGVINLMPGNYTATINNVSNTNVDLADPIPTRNITVTAAGTVNLLVAYAVIARLVTIQVTGLLLGLNPDITLSRNGQTVPITSLNYSGKLAVGHWNVSSSSRTMNGHTYALVTSALLGIDVVAAFDPLAVIEAYYQTQWQFTALVALGVLAGDDPFGHALFVLMWAQNTLNILRSFPIQAQIIAPQQAGTETVTISGPSPFITVTGTRATDGTLNLTGTGTAAGFSNVPALLTGNLSNTNVFTTNGTTGGAKYRLGQPTAPTGLPNGPITYTLTGSGPAAVFQR